MEDFVTSRNLIKEVTKLSDDELSNLYRNVTGTQNKVAIEQKDDDSDNLSLSDEYEHLSDIEEIKVKEETKNWFLNFIESLKKFKNRADNEIEFAGFLLTRIKTNFPFKIVSGTLISLIFILTALALGIAGSVIVSELNKKK